MLFTNSLSNVSKELGNFAAAGDLYGAGFGGDLYGAAPAAPQVEMATRGGKRFNYEDVYAELARQNKKGTVEDTLVDSILSRGVRGLSDVMARRKQDATL